MFKPRKHNELPDESIERLEAIKLTDEPVIVPITYGGMSLTCPKCKLRIIVHNPYRVTQCVCGQRIKAQS